MDIKEKTLNGVIWNYIQNIGTQVVNFIVSIIIARILAPSDYGLVSLTTIFTTVANVFVTTGFSAAIIQKKGLTKEQESSLYLANVFVGFALYWILFFLAGPIAQFCKEQELVLVIRVQSVSCFIASLYSVPQALLSRELNFKLIAIIRCSGVVVHGIVGIVLAVLGYGAYALVYSTIAGNISILIMTVVLVKWRPILCFRFREIRSMLVFSLKVLGTNLINTIYNNVSSLFVGRTYNSEQLGFYNRGYSFPTTIMVAIDGTLSSVMFPAMSTAQQDSEELGRMLRRTIQISMFVCAPLMLGLVAVARPFILILLTEKWSESIKYVQLMSIVCLAWPLSAGIQALNAMGKSGTTLFISTAEKIFGIIILIATVSISVQWVLYSTMISTAFGCILKAIAYKRYIGYKFLDQLKDFFKPIAISALMFIPIYFLSKLSIPIFVLFVFEVLAGIVTYVIASYFLNRASFQWLLNVIKNKFSHKSYKRKV